MKQTPSSTRAAILVGLGEPLAIGEVEMPPELTVGQVLVRVHLAGVCGSQVGERAGIKGADRWLPHLLGHEGYATVLACGPGVGTVKVGDSVILHWRPGQGIEAPPAKYAWGGRTVSAGRVTSFQDYAVVSENRISVAPPGVRAEHCVLLGCALSTGLGIVSRDAQLRVGESLVVVGAGGGVGASVVAGGRLAGAARIVAVDRGPGSLAIASQLGATDLIDADANKDWARDVRNVLDDTEVDVVVETSGNASCIEAAYGLAGARGRLVLAGVPAHDQPARLGTLALHLGRRLTGSEGGATDPDYDFPRYGRLLASGRLEVGAMLGARIGLEQINEAMDAMQAGVSKGRTLVVLDSAYTVAKS